jgi:hypothetical protein
MFLGNIEYMKPNTSAGLNGDFIFETSTGIIWKYDSEQKWHKDYTYNLSDNLIEPEYYLE